MRARTRRRFAPALTEFPYHLPRQFHLPDDLLGQAVNRLLMGRGQRLAGEPLPAAMGSPIRR